MSDVLVEFPRQATAQADDAIAVGFEYFAVYSRVVVEPFQKRQRGELDQVLEPHVILGKQRKVRGVPFILDRFLVHSASWSEITLVADDGVDSTLAAFVVKLDRAIQIAVVGDRAGSHPQAFRLLDQWWDAVETVEQAIVRVQVEVSKLSANHRRSPRNSEQTDKRWRIL
jgi:hypothetical protein